MQTQVAELLIRGGAVGTFALIAIGVILGGRTPARIAAAIFCAAAASHTLTQSPAAFVSLGLAAGPVWVLSVMGAGLFWAFGLELFGDSARLAPVRFMPAAVLLATGGLAAISPPDLARWLWLAQNVEGAVLILHLFVVIWIGWRGDLVEARRRLRGPVLGAAALYALIVLAVQSAGLFSQPAEQLSILAALSLLALSLAGGAVFLRGDPVLFGSTRREGGRNVAPQDQHLLGRLREVFDRQELWREEGLTIRGLAARLGAPEHHLRRLINEGLGYRNFAAFINEHRIEAAKRALADPAKARTSVATVAFEVGFSSLGPFNRAFREAVGETPSVWRKGAQASWSIPEGAG